MVKMVQLYFSSSKKSSSFKVTVVFLPKRTFWKRITVCGRREILIESLFTSESANSTVPEMVWNLSLYVKQICLSVCPGMVFRHAMSLLFFTRATPGDPAS